MTGINTGSGRGEFDLDDLLDELSDQIGWCQGAVDYDGDVRPILRPALERVIGAVLARVEAGIAAGAQEVIDQAVAAEREAIRQVLAEPDSTWRFTGPALAYFTDLLGGTASQEGHNA